MGLLLNCDINFDHYNRITKKYKLVFSAIDLVKTKNDEFYFLELNPNGQWAWIEEQTGYQITEKLVEVLKNG